VARKWLKSAARHFAVGGWLLGLTERIERHFMHLTAWQKLRTRLFLFAVAIKRRLTVGVRAILIDDGKVLLVRHTYLPGWHFPGGGVEPGETAQTAAAREALEETGYAVVGEPQLLGFYLNRIAGTARDHVAAYVWRGVERHHEASVSFEIAEVRWFALNALPPDIEAGTARRLVELAGAPPAAEW
jgi:ADP-ribose pyrophosphatase YjhB (NUDIX family)